MAALSAPREGTEIPADPPQARASFASLVSNRAGTEDFNVIAKISTKDGIPLVTFESNDLARAAFSFRFALVMKFAFSQRPSVEIIRSIVQHKWGLQAVVSILDPRHVLLKFFHEIDMVKALSRESNRIGGVFYKISRWSPDFDPKYDASLAPVWVQLKDLPVHMYLPSILRNISRPIGRYLKSDNATTVMSNTTRARFCVEVDLMQPLPDKVATNVSKTRTIQQPIFYEDVPKFCLHCRIQGHSDSNCHKLHSELKNDKAISGQSKQSKPVRGEQNLNLEGNASKDDSDDNVNEPSKENVEVVVVEGEHSLEAHQVFDNVPETRLDGVEQIEGLAVVEDGEILASMSNLEKNDTAVVGETLAIANSLENNLVTYLDSDFVNTSATRAIEKVCGPLPDQPQVQDGVVALEVAVDLQDTVTGQLEGVGVESVGESSERVAETQFHPTKDVNSATSNGDGWTTVEHRCKKKSKVVHEKTKSGYTIDNPRRSSRIFERSPGEIEPNLAMVKKVTSFGRNKKIRTLEGYIKEIMDDTLGRTFGCVECGSFFHELDKAQMHLRKEHPEIVRQIWIGR